MPSIRGEASPRLTWWHAEFPVFPGRMTMIRPRHVTRTLLTLAAVLLWPGALPSQAQVQLQLEPVASGLDLPIGIVNAGDTSGRLFVVLQRGQLVAIQGGAVQSPAFLDLSGLVSRCAGQGMLGVAFHPQFASNGFLFVNYTDANGDTVIARYHAEPNAATVDPATGQVLLTIQQPFTNHNGGELQFGP